MHELSVITGGSAARVCWKVYALADLLDDAALRRHVRHLRVRVRRLRALRARGGGGRGRMAGHHARLTHLHDEQMWLYVSVSG